MRCIGFLILFSPATLLADNVDLTIKFSGDVSKTAAAQIMDNFFTACAEMYDHYLGDIEKIEAEVIQYNEETCNYNVPCENYGWKKQVRLRVKIKNDPKFIPDQYRAWGHTLHYVLGGGDKPGIYSVKEQSSFVCGFYHSASSNEQFRGVPSMNFIDGPHVKPRRN